MKAPTVFEMVDRVVAPAATPSDLADKWQHTAAFSQEYWSEDMIRKWLSCALAYHLAVMELPWALPRMREASQIRAAQIVDQIGWPDRDWLEGAIAARVYALTPRRQSERGDR